MVYEIITVSCFACCKFDSIHRIEKCYEYIDFIIRSFMEYLLLFPSFFIMYVLVMYVVADVTIMFHSSSNPSRIFFKKSRWYFLVSVYLGLLLFFLIIITFFQFKFWLFLYTIPKSWIILHHVCIGLTFISSNVLRDK